MWAEKGKQPIRPKGLGRGIMVSDFVDEFNGLLTLTKGEFERGRLIEESMSVTYYIVNVKTLRIITCYGF